MHILLESITVGFVLDAKTESNTCRGDRFCRLCPDVRYTNTITKASLAVYGTWFALVVNTDDYEGEFYPETKVPTYQEIRAWIKKKYGFNVNSASISQTKRKYGLIADSGDTERRYIQKVKPEKEAAIREALVWFGIIK